MRFEFLTLIAVTIILVAATFVEKFTGSAAMIYGSWWFAAIWGVIAVSGLCYCVRRRLMRRPAAMLLHVAFGVMLLGALITQIWGVQGVADLRKGQPVSAFVTDGDQPCPFPFALTLDDFEVAYYRGTSSPRDYRSTVQVTSDREDPSGQTPRQLHISMNHIGEVQGYRLYQSSYDTDLRGTVLTVCHDPWGIGITYLGYAMLFLSMLLLLILPRQGFRPCLRQATRRQQWWYAVVFALACGIALWVVWRIYSKPLLPVLRSPYLGIHVGIIVVAYTLLAVIAIGGYRFRPMLYPALFCLIAGIFIGAIWANQSWGRYWGWDSKEVWALITMLIYSLPMHSQSIRWMAHPRHFHLYCAVAFLSVLMTYFGVNYFLTGLHSYA